MKEMNKQELKAQTINIKTKMEELVAKLMAPACCDDETGRMRSQVYSAMNELNDKLADIIYNIY